MSDHGQSTPTKALPKSTLEEGKKGELVGSKRAHSEKEDSSIYRQMIDE